MKRLKKILLRTFITLGVIYLAVCGLMFFFQEKFIFHPRKLNADYKFNYEQKFEEIFVEASDGSQLNGLLFTADSSKGLVIYLHGNSGALDNWGDIAPRYTKLGYDILFLTTVASEKAKVHWRVKSKCTAMFSASMIL